MRKQIGLAAITVLAALPAFLGEAGYRALQTTKERTPAPAGAPCSPTPNCPCKIEADAVGVTLYERTATGIGGSGGIDSCLVGTWRSTFVTSSRVPVVVGGGAGIMLTIDRDGNENVDYNQMQPVQHASAVPGGVTFTEQWSGTQPRKIVTKDGKATTVHQGIDTNKQTFVVNGVTQSRIEHGGLAALGDNSMDPSYTCDATTLKFKYVQYGLTFERQARTTSR